MKSFRTLLFWCHLAVGTTVAAVVVIMAFTGALLAYQKQITAWADRRAVDARPPAANAQRLPVEELLRRAAAAAGAVPTAVTLRSRADAPAEVSFGRDRRELVNAYTGQILGAGSTGARSFFRIVTAWHRTLGATDSNRAIGRTIADSANFAFLFLVLSGFVLWWPRNWSLGALRNVMVFRRRLSGRARDFNWHNVIGFWSALPLALIVTSGVVMSYRWAGNLVYRSMGESPPVRATAQPLAERSGSPRALPDRQPSLDGLNVIFSRGQERVPGWSSISAQIPNGGEKTITLSLDAGTGGQPQLRSQLVLDRVSGDEIRWEPFSSQTAGRRLRTLFRFAHTGEVFGIVGQTIAGLVSLGAVMLACTGIALMLRRFAGWRARRADVQ